MPECTPAGISVRDKCRLLARSRIRMRDRHRNGWPMILFSSVLFFLTIQLSWPQVSPGVSIQVKFDLSDGPISHVVRGRRGANGTSVGEPSGVDQHNPGSFVKNRAASTERRYYILPTCLRPALAIDCLHRGIQSICHGNMVYNNRPSKIATDSPQST